MYVVLHTIINMSIIEPDIIVIRNIVMNYIFTMAECLLSHRLSTFVAKYRL